MDRRTCGVAAVGVVLTLLAACQLSEADVAARSAVRRGLQETVSRRRQQLRSAGGLTCSASSDCGVNEQCLNNDVDSSLNVSLATLGRCVCSDGYARGAPDLQCSPTPSAATKKPAETTAPAANNSNSEGRIALSEVITTTGRGQMVNVTGLKSLTAAAVATTLATTTAVRDPGGALVSLTTTSAAKTLPLTAKLIYQLNVSAGEDVVLRFPNDSVELSAHVQVPARLQNDSFKYAWTFDHLPSIVAGDGQSGVMRGLTDPTLKLSKLIAGVYRVRLVVESDNSFGMSFVNITVLPPIRINQPPKAIIKPSDQQVTHGNTAVLDGSGSTDDDKIVSYLWEVVNAPVVAVAGNIQYASGRERPMLQISGLAPGQYTIRLTVTDSDGVQNSTTARLVIVKEIDYPPKANAGSDVIINMPQQELVLMGNASTDDKGIVSYEWTKATESPAVDISGARTPYLKLSNIQSGHYTFTLKVTDAAEQSSTDDVQVFVKEELNRAPIAVVSNASILVRLVPGATVQLDGSRSSDDHDIVRYEWIQQRGPSVAQLQSPDRAVATAAGLTPGHYQFRLTVHDAEQLSSSTLVEVEAVANINRPPVARACGNMSIKLPKPLLTLDGSQSSDEDGRIVSYLWKREPLSPAAGDIVDGSDHEAVLRLAGPVVGRYMWSLTVTDNEGLMAADLCVVNVTHGANDLDIVEVFLEVSIEDFSEAKKERVASELNLLLRQPDEVANTAAAASGSESGATGVNILRVSTDGLTGLLVVSFVVLDGSPKAGRSVRRGPDVAHMLREKLRRNADVLDFKVHSVSTLICQNNCSGHGHCSRFTKACVCDSFWMQNVFRNYMDGESNCEWSVVYVVVIGFGALAGLVLLLGICACACRKRCCTRSASGKRRSYQLVDGPETDDGKSSLLPKRTFTLSDDCCNNNTVKSDAHTRQKSLLLKSDSELSSDEDTLFVSSRGISAKAKWSPAVETEETAALTGSNESRA